MDNERKIALALSGGGSRAIAFHLGCLRSLHQHNLLHDVKTISSVSGGSVIAAAYFKFGAEFDEFEKRIKALLKSGLVRPTMKTLCSHWGVIWIVTECVVLILSVLNWLVALAPKLIRSVARLFEIQI